MNRRAFTLVEVLAVIAIMLILMGITYPVYNSWKESAKHSQSRVVLTLAMSALYQYSEKYNDLPHPAVKDGRNRWSTGTFQDAQPFLDKARVSKTYLNDIPKTCIVGSNIVDVWGKPIRYSWHYPDGAGDTSHTSYVMLTSSGADGSFDTADDLQERYNLKLKGN